MLITLLLVGQMVMAQRNHQDLRQPRIPDSTPRIAPRTDPTLQSQDDPGNLRAACEAKGDWDPNSKSRCVSQYTQENTWFDESSVQFCRTSMHIMPNHKKMCIEFSKKRKFNISNLNRCLAEARGKNNLNELDEPYTKCFNNKDNLVQPASADTKAGR